MVTRGMIQPPSVDQAGKPDLHLCVQMLMQESYQFTQWNVANGTAAEIGHEQVKRQLAAVMLFQCFAQDDGVDRGEAEIAEKARVRINVAGIFAAIEIPQNAG